MNESLKSDGERGKERNSVSTYANRSHQKKIDKNNIIEKYNRRISNFLKNNSKLNQSSKSKSVTLLQESLNFTINKNNPEKNSSYFEPYKTDANSSCKPSVILYTPKSGVVDLQFPAKSPGEENKEDSVNFINNCNNFTNITNCQFCPHCNRDYSTTTFDYTDDIDENIKNNYTSMYSSNYKIDISKLKINEKRTDKKNCTHNTIKNTEKTEENLKIPEMKNNLVIQNFAHDSLSDFDEDFLDGILKSCRNNNLNSDDKIPKQLSPIKDKFLLFDEMESITEYRK